MRHSLLHAPLQAARRSERAAARRRRRAARDLGYIKFGVFIADNRHFSVTLATPEIETEMRMAVMKPENFDAICMALPGAARWMNPERAEPVSQVFAMGNLQNVWRHYLKDGEPQVLNFFAIGDAAIRTNPLYGRGCSSGRGRRRICCAARSMPPSIRSSAPRSTSAN